MAIECSICYEIFDKDNSEVVVTKCGHMFHTDCLNDWLKSSNTCPHCRVTIRRKNELRKIFVINSRSSMFDTTNNEIRQQLERENNELLRQLVKEKEERNSLISENKRLQEEANDLRSQISALKHRIEQIKKDHNGNINRAAMVHKQFNSVNPLYAHVKSKVSTAWKKN
ncbi:E3 ubiquitin-protein ligase TRAIP-like [Contarinia nasturtii]|uniref:E3 ubiquitin-protein ligase TRAIP-like n=1 Tax=Contarinia nasturtii TaxID=265458 RepID=UPI0012D40B12|nr:E3 ubiquitin-protein ligase TRAIP-like [Contarinia nasturtii]